VLKIHLTKNGSLGGAGSTLEVGKKNEGLEKVPEGTTEQSKEEVGKKRTAHRALAALVFK